MDNVELVGVAIGAAFDAISGPHPAPEGSREFVRDLRWLSTRADRAGFPGAAERLRRLAIEVASEIERRAAEDEDGRAGTHRCLRCGRGFDLHDLESRLMNPSCWDSPLSSCPEPPEYQYRCPGGHWIKDDEIEEVPRADH